MTHTLKTSTAFPAARPSPDQKAEDDFMDMHGGNGTRALFLGVEALASAVRFLGQLLRAAATLPSRIQARPAVRRPRTHT